MVEENAPGIDPDKIYSLKEFSELWEFYEPEELAEVVVHEPERANYLDENGEPFNLNPFGAGTDPHDEDFDDAIKLSEIKSDDHVQLFISTIGPLLGEIKNKSMDDEDILYLKEAFVRQFTFDYYISPKDYEKLEHIAEKHDLGMEEDFGIAQSDIAYSIEDFVKLFTKHYPKSLDKLHDITVHDADVDFRDENGVPFSLNFCSMEDEVVYEANPALGTAAAMYMLNNQALSANPKNPALQANTFYTITNMAAASQPIKRVYAAEGSNDPSDWDTIDVSDIAGDDPKKAFVEAIGVLLDKVDSVPEEGPVKASEKQKFKEYFVGQFDLSSVNIYRDDYEALAAVAAKHHLSMEDDFGITEKDIVKERLSTEQFIELLLEHSRSGNKFLDLSDMDITRVDIMGAIQDAQDQGFDLFNISLSGSNFSHTRMTEWQAKQLVKICEMTSSGMPDMSTIESDKSFGEGLLSGYIGMQAENLVERNGRGGR